MAIIIRTIQNITSAHSDITLLVPGYNTEKTPVTIPWNTTVDLFTVMTGDQLEAIQTTLAQYLSLGQIAVIATVDTATFNPVGGNGVPSINGIIDAVTLAAGSNVTITPSGSTLTIASTGGGGGSPAGIDGQIQYNDSGAFGANALLSTNKTDALFITRPSGGVSLRLDSDGGPSLIEFNNFSESITYANISGDPTGLAIELPGFTWKFNADGGLDLPNLGTEPGSPIEGEVIYNSTSHQMEVWNGTSWVAAGGGGSPASPTGSIQFNNGGSFGGDSNLTYSTGTLTLGKAPVLPSSSFSASGGTITPDATAGTTVFVTVDATCTINGPTSPYDGQKITFRLAQDATGHTVTFSTGAGNFLFGTDIPSFTASGANLIDYVGAIYDSISGCWDVVSVIQGF